MLPLRHCSHVAHLSELTLVRGREPSGERATSPAWSWRALIRVISYGPEQLEVGYTLAGTLWRRRQPPQICRTSVG